MPSVGSGSRIPPGGTPDQVLRKKSPVDFDLRWDDVNALQGEPGPKGDKGDQGDPGVKGDTGAGVPTGGTTGQALVKASTTNYATTWATISGVPTGGATGQALVKNSATNYDVGWTTPASGGGGGGHLFPWSGTGRTFFPPGDNYVSGQSFPNIAAYLNFYPVMVPNACAVASVSVMATNNYAGSTIYLSLWADNPAATSGGPGARLTFAAATWNGPGTPTSVTFATPYSFTGPTPIWVGIGSSTNLVKIYASGQTGLGTTMNMVLGPMSGTQWLGTDSLARSCLYSASLSASSAGAVANASNYSFSVGQFYVPMFYFTLA